MFSFFIDLNIIFQSFIASLFLLLMTTVGSLFVFFFKHNNSISLNIFTYLITGIMLSSAFFSLLLPSFDLTNNYIFISLGLLFGSLFLFCCDFFFKKSRNRGNSIFISMLLHNIPEGLAIGASFGAGNIYTSLLLTLSIGIQNIPDGSSVSIPYYKMGYSKQKSFIMGSLSGVVEVFASIIGTYLSMKINFFLPFFMSFAAGAILYAFFNDLIVECIETNNKYYSMFVIMGFCFLMLVDLYLS